MENLNEESCSICLDPLAFTDDPEKRKGGMVSTVCNHYFHRDCLLGWLNTKDRGKWCPLCKRAFGSKLVAQIQAAFGMPAKREVLLLPRLPPGLQMVRIRSAVGSAVAESNRRVYRPFPRNEASILVTDSTGTRTLELAQWRRAFERTEMTASPSSLPAPITRADRMEILANGPPPAPSVSTTRTVDSAAPPAPANRPSTIVIPRVELPPPDRPSSVASSRAAPSISANAPSGTPNSFLPTATIPTEAPNRRSRDERNIPEQQPTSLKRKRTLATISERQGSESRMLTRSQARKNAAGGGVEPSRRERSRSPVALSRTVKRRRQR